MEFQAMVERAMEIRQRYAEQVGRHNCREHNDNSLG